MMISAAATSTTRSIITVISTSSISTIVSIIIIFIISRDAAVARPLRRRERRATHEIGRAVVGARCLEPCRTLGYGTLWHSMLNCEYVLV